MEGRFGWKIPKMVDTDAKIQQGKKGIHQDKTQQNKHQKPSPRHRNQRVVYVKILPKSRAFSSNVEGAIRVQIARFIGVVFTPKSQIFLNTFVLFLVTIHHAIPLRLNLD